MRNVNMRPTRGSLAGPDFANILGRHPQQALERAGANNGLRTRQSRPPQPQIDERLPTRHLKDSAILNPQTRDFGPPPERPRLRMRKMGSTK